MSRARINIFALTLAIVATVVGWSQSLIYYRVPPIPLALWFPFIVLADLNQGPMILVSLIQFPLFAMVFVTAIRWWPMVRVGVTLAFIYALCAGTAVHLVANEPKP